MVDGADRHSDFLALQRREITLLNTRAVARDHGHGLIDAGLRCAPGVVAEQHVVGSGQRRTDNRGANLGELDLVGLKGIQHVDAAGEWLGQFDVEAGVLEEPFVEGCGQAHLVDGAHPPRADGGGGLIAGWSGSRRATRRHRGDERCREEKASDSRVLTDHCLFTFHNLVISRPCCEANRTVQIWDIPGA